VSRRLFAAVSISALLLGTIGYLVLPRLAIRLLKARDRLDRIYNSSPRADYAGPVLEIEPTITISAPRTVRVTSTKPISISIGKTVIGHSDLLPGGSTLIASDEPPTVDNRVLNSYTVDLRVVDGAGVVCAEPKKRYFESPQAIEGVLTWQCTIHPKEAGDYDILVTGLPTKDVGWISVNDAVNGTPGTGSPDYKVLSDGTFSISVSALTPQGIPAREWAWLQAVGGLLGVVGTVLGYPFIKSMVESKSTRRSAIRELLGTVDDNMTKSYNALVSVFTPFLHPANFQSGSTNESHLEAAEEFALKREFRQEIQKALASINQYSLKLSNTDARCLRAVSETATRFLAVVSSEQCFLEKIRANAPDLPASIDYWIRESRVAHDEVIKAVGDALASIG
jgi:hypothetical protein